MKIALEAKGINMRRASLAPRNPDGKPLLGATYVRDLIERGRGTKERLELICDATGISFDFVWNNRGAAVASADPGSEPDLIISSGFLRGAVEEALRLIGASLEESKVIAGLLLTKIAREQTPGATGRS